MIKRYFRHLKLIAVFLKQQYKRFPKIKVGHNKAKRTKEGKIYIQLTWILLTNYIFKGLFFKVFILKLPEETIFYGNSKIKITNTNEYILENILKKCRFEILDEELVYKSIIYYVSYIDEKIIDFESLKSKYISKKRV